MFGKLPMEKWEDAQADYIKAQGYRRCPNDITSTNNNASVLSAIILNTQFYENGNFIYEIRSSISYVKQANQS